MKLSRKTKSTYILDIQMTLKVSGRAIAQAVSSRIPKAAARVPARVRLRGICGAQSGIAADFLRVLRCPLPILIPPTAPHSSSFIIRGWYNRPTCGRRTKRTQSHPVRKKSLKLT
jgi:hypothetical protein